MIFGRKKKVVESAIESGENAIANKEVEGLSQGQIVLRRFLRHRAAVISLTFIIAVLLFVFSSLNLKIGPFQYHGWWKYKVDDLPELRYGDCPGGTIGCPTISVVPKFLGGNGIHFGEHPFGQDDIGRD